MKQYVIHHKKLDQFVSMRADGTPVLKTEFVNATMYNPKELAQAAIDKFKDEWPYSLDIGNWEIREIALVSKS